MRTMLIYIIVLFFCVSCQGQQSKKSIPSRTEIIDTLNVLTLKEKRYKIAHLGNRDNGREQIQLLKNNIQISSILLPVADEEVKNFSVNKMEETQKGFKISVDWGGGNYFYERIFFFSYKENKFYLDTLEINNFTQEPEKKTTITKAINPPIEISKLNIFDYIKND